MALINLKSDRWREIEVSISGHSFHPFGASLTFFDESIIVGERETRSVLVLNLSKHAAFGELTDGRRFVFMLYEVSVFMGVLLGDRINITNIQRKQFLKA